MRCNRTFALPERQLFELHPLVRREHWTKASAEYWQSMMYPLQSNVEANTARRLSQIYCALSDGDLKEAERIYKEIAIRTTRAADSDSRPETVSGPDI